jgi:hypothetical protein
MCLGGSNAATNAEAAQNAQSQATTAANINQINSAFANRGAQYTTYGNALQQQYQTALQQQQQVAQRNMTFGLASSGLTGSSDAAYQGTLLGKDMTQGELTAQQQVQGDVAGLQAKDAATKQQMISLAESGGNIGNAAAETSQALSANYGSAQNANVTNSLGNMFGDVTSNVNNMSTAAQYRQGYLQGTGGTNTAALYGNSITGGNSGGSTGVL